MLLRSAPSRICNQRHRDSTRGLIVRAAEAGYYRGSGIPQHDLLERLVRSLIDRELLRRDGNMAPDIDIDHERDARPDIPELEAVVSVRDLLGIKRHSPNRPARLVVTDSEGSTRHAAPAGVNHPSLDSLSHGQGKREADGNGGVYIHTAFDGDTPRTVAGRQIEIDRTLGRNTRGL